jgi:hypothetical protein
VALTLAARSTFDDDRPDPRVLEFTRILEGYRSEAELEGRYDEAQRTTEQLELIRRAEEDRQMRATRHTLARTREEVAAEHAAQFQDFCSAWDRYMAEFDAMSALYLEQMRERHAEKLKEFVEGVNEELLRKPIKWSRDLLQWRGREALMAKNRQYVEAQRVKVMADELERRERNKMEDERLAVVLQKEAKMRTRQEGEMQALVKRIDARRAEHITQRELDTKRLLQRNKNVLQAVGQKQAAAENAKATEVRLSLMPKKFGGNVAGKSLDFGYVKSKTDTKSGRGSVTAFLAEMGIGIKPKETVLGTANVFSAPQSAGGQGGMSAPQSPPMTSDGLPIRQLSLSSPTTPGASSRLQSSGTIGLPIRPLSSTTTAMNRGGTR